jgi:hypothetical protein
MDTTYRGYMYAISEWKVTMWIAILLIVHSQVTNIGEIYYIEGTGAVKLK